MRYHVYQKTGLNGSWGTTPIDTIEFQSSDVTFTVGGLNTASNNYCYKIVTFDECGTKPELASEEICSMILNATANTSRNAVQWGSYAKTTNGVNYNLDVNGSTLTTTSQNLPKNTPINYLDADVLCKQNYCYQVTASYGVSGIQSISALVCVVGEKQIGRAHV